MTKKSRNTILHLARWYPNKYDPMFGLFVQKHAEAAAKYCKIGVVYVHQLEKSQKQNEIYCTDFSMENGVPTARVYYKSSPLPIIGKIANAIRFLKANNRGVKKVCSEIGKYDLIHVHILTRLGVIALWKKITTGTPYIISEHWSRYLDLTGNFHGTLRKFFTKLVVKNASTITTVTQNLAVAMKKHNLNNHNYIVFPNVVDSSFTSIKLPEKNNDIPTFVHVSCFEDRSKNISGLLRVISELEKQSNSFIFKLIGDGQDMQMLKSYSQELGISIKHLIFTGLLEGKKLAQEMSSADMLIVFSNYENMPVVINESLCMGVPVIATKVGGIPEVINSKNGILIDRGDEKALLNNLKNLLEGKLSFNMDNIKKQAIEQYSSDSVGKQLAEIYKQL